MIEKPSTDQPKLTRRDALFGAGSAALAGVIPDTAEGERLPDAAIEKITTEDVDRGYQIIGYESTAIPQAEAHERFGEALIVIDWQESFLNSRENTDPTIVEQLEETQKNIIDAIATAKRNGDPIVLVGVSNQLDLTPASVLKGEAGHDFLGENYPSAVLEALADYEEVHYLIKERNSVAAEGTESRVAIEALLETVETARVVGLNEGICAYRSVTDLTHPGFSSAQLKVVVNPSELADTESVIDSHIDSRKRYDDIPKAMLFTTAFEKWLADDLAVDSLAVELTERRPDGEEEVVRYPFSMIQSEWQAFLDEGTYPEFMH